MADLSAEQAVEIDSDDLQSEFIKQPGYYFYFSQKLEEVRYLLHLSKVDLEVTEARLYSDCRDELSAGNNRVTEAQIVNSMKSKDEWVEKQKKVAELKKAEGKFRAVVEALTHKKDMLMQLGAFKRSEFHAEPVIRGDKDFEKKAQTELETLKAKAKNKLKSMSKGEE